MNIYHYNEAGEYTRTSVANLDPKETALKGEPVYAIPANATKLEPNVKLGFLPLYSNRRGERWNNRADNRGKKYFLPGDITEYTITELGVSLPDGNMPQADATAIEKQELDIAKRDLKSKRTLNLKNVTVTIGSNEIWADPKSEQNILGRIRVMEATGQNECKWVQGDDILTLTLNELKTVLADGTNKCASIYDEYISALESI